MIIVDCPWCKENEAEIDDGFKCNQCGQMADGETAAREHIDQVMGKSEMDVAQGGEYPLDHCPECGAFAYVDYGPSGDIEPQTRARCYQCGHEVPERTDLSDVRTCMKCGSLFSADDSMTVCDDCFQTTLDKD